MCADACCRGPITSQERHLFLEYDKQLAAAEAALANSEQEAIRATRRAQREQQVCCCWEQSCVFLSCGILQTQGWRPKLCCVCKLTCMYGDA